MLKTFSSAIGIGNGKKLEKKEDIDEENNNNNSFPSKLGLRPSRAVPALPASDEEEEDINNTSDDIYDETKNGSKLNSEDLVTSSAFSTTTTTTSSNSSNNQNNNNYINSNSNINNNNNSILDEKVSTLQRQNRNLLKQIVSMKQTSSYSNSSIGVTSLNFSGSSSSNNNNMFTSSSPRNGVNGGGIKYDDDQNDETMHPMQRMKNQLALCELKLRRAHKNFHDLSKRTRELETENARAERNLLDLSNQVKVAKGTIRDKDKLYTNLQKKYQNACATIEKIKLTHEKEQNNEIKELKQANSMLVKHAKMCEQRVTNSEKLAHDCQQQLEASNNNGLKWKKDRQDIGNYALSLESALKKAQKNIQALKRKQQEMIADHNKNNNMMYNAQTPRDMSFNTNIIPNVNNTFTRTFDDNNNGILSPSAKATFVNNTNDNNINSTNSPSTSSFLPSPPPPPPLDDDSTLYRAPPPSSPVTQEFFS